MYYLQFLHMILIKNFSEIFVKHSESMKTWREGPLLHMFHEKMSISTFSPLLQCHPVKAPIWHKKRCSNTACSQSCKSHIVLEFLDHPTYSQELKSCSSYLQCPQKTSASRIWLQALRPPEIYRTLCGWKYSGF